MYVLTVDINYIDDAPHKFDESKHPRGQPENKGEFVSKGSGVFTAPPPKTHFHAKPMGMIQSAANGAESIQERAAKIHAITKQYKHMNVSSYANTVLRAMEKHHGLSSMALGKASPLGAGNPSAAPKLEPEVKAKVEQKPEPAKKVEQKPEPAKKVEQKPEPAKKVSGIDAIYDIIAGHFFPDVKAIKIVNVVLNHPGENEVIDYANAVIGELKKNNLKHAASIEKLQKTYASELHYNEPKKSSPAASSVAPELEPEVNLPDVVIPLPNPASQTQQQMYELAVANKVAELKEFISKIYKGGYAEKYGNQLLNTIAPGEAKTATPHVPNPTSNTPVEHKVLQPENPVASWKKAMAEYEKAYKPTDYDAAKLVDYFKIADNAAWDKIPGKYKEACKNYISGSGSINNLLRNPVNADAHPELVATIKAIDDLFATEDAITEQDFVVNRGMTLPEGLVKTLLSSLKKGLPARFHQDGFISTSAGKAAMSGEINMEILVRKGTPALGFYPIAPGPYKHEREILLRHGQGCEVLQAYYWNNKLYMRVATITN